MPQDGTPTKRRFEISQVVTGIKIVIPGPRSVILFLFLGFWLCGWAAGEIFGVGALFSPKTPTSAKLFLVVWVGGWTVGGVMALAAWLWNLAGREIIEVNGARLSIAKQVFGLGPKKEFDLSLVRGLRKVGNEINEQTPRKRRTERGRLAFDYGNKTVRFCAGLDDSEASSLLSEFKHRYPFTSTLNAFP